LPHLESAIRDLGLKRDKRGLMPLREARRRVNEVDQIKRGKSHRIDGQAFRPTDAAEPDVRPIEPPMP
jgi:hypothetical protein